MVRFYEDKPQKLTHLSKVLPWRPRDLQAIQENFDLIDVGGNRVSTGGWRVGCAGLRA
jgi:hypothetical protein